jgi:protease IV
LLRIDSGGGSAQASDVIRNSLVEAKQKKPLVVSMADTAASGGYMIAAPADLIVADPFTVTGSIGIFGGKFSIQGLNTFLGIKIETVQRGNNAGIFSVARVQTREELERFQSYIQQGYDEFVGGVARDRKMTVADVDAVAQGRVWTGARAAKIGLVDQLGGMETALAALKEKIGIPAEQDVQLVEYPEMESPFAFLLRRFQETYFFGGRVPKEVTALRQQLDSMARLQEESLFAWWPCQITVAE